MSESNEHPITEPPTPYGPDPDPNPQPPTHPTPSDAPADPVNPPIKAHGP